MNTRLLCWGLGLVLAQAAAAAQPVDDVVKAPAIVEALSKDVVLDRTHAARPARAPRAIELQVQFTFNSARLLPQGKRQLDELAMALSSRTLAASRFELAGHTDAVGNPAYNARLSLERAQAVMAYLMSAHLLPQERLQAIGRGSSRLADPFHPEAAINRRVEVRALPLGNAAPGHGFTGMAPQPGGRLQASPK